MSRGQKNNNPVVFFLTLLVIIETLVIIFLFNQPGKKLTKIPVVSPKIKGRIAIVLDDWGYSAANLAALRSIKSPLTLAVLPNLQYSALIAKEAHNLGDEVILHLPMEPREGTGLERNTILTSMSSAQVRNILAQDLNNIPDVVGVSNHMGSKATESSKIMTIVLRELKKRKLYFLDSFVSSNSVCLDLAHRERVPVAKRDIFLDNKLNVDYIKAELTKLKIRASIYGEAIGIGHDRQVTLQALKEVMPSMEKDGYKFVRISELVR